MTQTKFTNRGHLEFVSREAARGSVCYCGKGRALCKVLDKIKMYVRADDVTMAPHLMQDGFWESWITMFVQNFVTRSNMHVVNVGAAFGYYSLFCAALGAKVTAFEPQQELAELLRWSVGANGFESNLTVVEAACGAEESRRRIYIDRHRVGGATFQERGKKYASLATPDELHVKMTTLDAYFDARNGKPPKVDLFIIDTEGHEPEVLAGAKQLLENNRHAVIVIEVTPAWWTQIDSCAGTLRDLERNYQFCDIDHEGKLVHTTTENVLSETQSTIALTPRM